MPLVSGKANNRENCRVGTNHTNQWRTSGYCWKPGSSLYWYKQMLLWYHWLLRLRYTPTTCLPSMQWVELTILWCMCAAPHSLTLLLLNEERSTRIALIDLACVNADLVVSCVSARARVMLSISNLGAICYVYFISNSFICVLVNYSYVHDQSVSSWTSLSTFFSPPNTLLSVTDFGILPPFSVLLGWLTHQFATLISWLSDCIIPYYFHPVPTSSDAYRPRFCSTHLLKNCSVEHWFVYNIYKYNPFTYILQSCDRSKTYHLNTLLHFTLFPLGSIPTTGK